MSRLKEDPIPSKGWGKGGGEGKRDATWDCKERVQREDRFQKDTKVMVWHVLNNFYFNLWAALGTIEYANNAAGVSSPVKEKGMKLDVVPISLSVTCPWKTGACAKGTQELCHHTSCIGPQVLKELAGHFWPHLCYELPFPVPAAEAAAGQG